MLEPETPSPEPGGEPDGLSQAEETEQGAEEAPEGIYVDVCGAVNAPGVYLLEKDARVFQALEAAGGVRADGAEDFLNRAEVLSDGERVCIPTREEAEEWKQGRETASADFSGDIMTRGSDGKVDLNRAGEEELCTLTGIGPQKAKAILAYREAHGGFGSIEELMDVEGIKEKTFEKLKDEIVVNN